MPDSSGVTLFGEMRAVMRDGHTEARTSIADHAAIPHAYAVGAVQGLDGEITVVDGEAWVSRVRDGAVVTTGPGIVPQDRATLLAVAHVPEWRDIRLVPGQGADIEGTIARAARDQGLDLSRPFPFLIEGTAVSGDIHVINGFCPRSGKETTPGNEPWRLRLSAPTRVIIVGFFASDSEGVMTHHGTAMHAHALLDAKGRRITGHVDEIAFDDGAVLRLPRSGR